VTVSFAEMLNQQKTKSFTSFVVAILMSGCSGICPSIPARFRVTGDAEFSERKDFLSCPSLT